jgi:transposase-like protein
MNLIDVTKQLGTDEQCIAYLEKMQWPDGIVRCPICGNDKISRITRKTASKNKRAQIFQCLEKTCKHQFSATTGTIFHDSHLPLHKWFIAIVVDAKKGISALQLQQHLGIGSYKTAWYMYHRIRKAMEEEGGFLSGTVEIDETYVGGRKRGIGIAAAKKAKQVVIGAIERGGKLRLRHIPNAKIETLRGFINEHVGPNVSRIMTDEHHAYPAALKPDLSDRHFTVNHIRDEYVRPGTDITTNSIESAFSLFKRGLNGSFHRVSIKHLHRYLSEFEYRFNAREIADRFSTTLKAMCGTKVMPYRVLVSEISDL